MYHIPFFKLKGMYHIPFSFLLFLIFHKIGLYVWTAFFGNQACEKGTLFFFASVK